MAPASFLVIMLKDPSKKNAADEESEDITIEASTLIVPGNQEDYSEDNGEELEKVTYGQLICKARIIFPAITCSLNAFVYCVFEPTLSLRLADYDVTQF